MESELDLLQRALDAANMKIKAQERENTQLSEKLQNALSVQQDYAILANEHKRSLQELNQENQRLSMENELLKINIQSKIDHISSVSSAERSTASRIPDRSTFLQRAEKERICKLEEEVLSLTSEKKQLMTHLHWLSRQRDETPFDRKGLEKFPEFGNQLSLEEGYSNDIQSYKSDSACKNELKTEDQNENFQTSSRAEANFERNVPSADMNSKQQIKNMKIKLPTNNLTRFANFEVEEISNGDVLAKLRKMRQKLHEAKKRVSCNNDLSDMIFQLSFQNLRHPYEPQSYSNWSSNDGTYSLSFTSLDKSKTVYRRQSRIGYYSLESLSPGVLFDPQHSQNMLSRYTCASSPEIRSSCNDGAYSPFTYDLPKLTDNVILQSKLARELPISTDSTAINNAPSARREASHSCPQSGDGENHIGNEVAYGNRGRISQTLYGRVVSQPLVDSETDGDQPNDENVFEENLIS